MLKRSHELVGNARVFQAVVAKDAKPLQPIILASELAEDLFEKRSLCRRQSAISEIDQSALDSLVLDGSFGQESREQVAVPMVGNEFPNLVSPRTLKRPNRFDPCVKRSPGLAIRTGKFTPPRSNSMSAIAISRQLWTVASSEMRLIQDEMHRRSIPRERHR